VTSWFRKYWQRVLLIALAGWLVIMWVGNNDVRQEYDNLYENYLLQVAHVETLTDALNNCRQGYQLRPFDSVEYFKDWVAQRDLNTGESGWQWALSIQKMAETEGYRIDCQPVYNIVGGGIVFIPTTKIGDKIYLIHPITHGVEEYYPRMVIRR